MATNTKNLGKLCENLSYSPRYKIIDEHTILVDKTGKGHYVELMDLDYSGCWEGNVLIQELSEKNPDYYYQRRWRQYLKMKGQRNCRIVTDVIESIYRGGERIK
jgi:hypothetical protein